jgi:hypothetical protein
MRTYTRFRVDLVPPVAKYLSLWKLLGTEVVESDGSHIVCPLNLALSRSLLRKERTSFVFLCVHLVRCFAFLSVSVGIKNIPSHLTGIILLVHFDIKPDPLTARCKSRSAAARLLSLWVRIPPVVWMSASCKCCVLSGRSLCIWRNACTEESYRVWCVVVCDLETPRIRRPLPTLGRSARGQNFST